LPLKTDLGKGNGWGTATHHQDEGIVGDVGHQDEEGQAEAESGAVEGVGYADDAAAHDGVDVVERGLWQRGQRVPQSGILLWLLLLLRGLPMLLLPLMLLLLPLMLLLRLALLLMCLMVVLESGVTYNKG